MTYDIPRATKQPSESRRYTFDFSKNMGVNDTIASVDSFTVSPSGPTLGSPVISGKQVQARVSGGTSGTQYKLTMVVTTSASDIIEGEAQLFVRNK